MCLPPSSAAARAQPPTCLVPPVRPSTCPPAFVPLPRFALLNDFEAVGYGVPALDPVTDLVTLNTGVPKEKVRRYIGVWEFHRTQPHTELYGCCC